MGYGIMKNIILQLMIDNRNDFMIEYNSKNVRVTFDDKKMLL